MFTPFAYRQETIVVVPTTTTTAAPMPSIRYDAYSGSVKLAVPGTQFDNVFSQSYFYSDISSYVRGTGNNVPLFATASGGSNILITSASTVTSGSGTYDFATDGDYTTSIYQEDGGTLGVITNDLLGFAANNFVVESWLYMNERLYSPAAPFHKSILRATNGFFSIDLSFQAQNSPQWRMRTIFNDTQYFSAAVSSDLNVWYHAAWVRSGNNFYWYWAGNRITGPTAMSGTQSSVNVRLLGGDLGANDGAKGSLQDIKISIGTDRGYTGTTITPPDSIVVLN